VSGKPGCVVTAWLGGMEANVHVTEGGNPDFGLVGVHGGEPVNGAPGVVGGVAHAVADATETHGELRLAPRSGKARQQHDTARISIGHLLIGLGGLKVAEGDSVNVARPSCEQAHAD
jgi:hypothetical protein